MSFPQPESQTRPKLTIRRPPPNLNTSYSASHESLAECFGRTEEEIRDWLKGKCFLPYLKRYQDEALNLAFKQVKLTATEPAAEISFYAVYKELQYGERPGVAEYSFDFPSKEKWTEINHLAFFLFRCHRTNKNTWNGILFKSDWTLDEQYYAIWQAIEFSTNATDRTKMEKAAKAGEEMDIDEEE